MLDELKEYFTNLASEASEAAFKVIDEGINNMPEELEDEYNKHVWIDDTGNRDDNGKYVVFDMMPNYDKFYDDLTDEEDF